jgi:hypothetical protein
MVGVGVGAGLVAGEVAGTAVGCGVAVWRGVAVRCGDAVADGDAVRCGVRRGRGGCDTDGVGELAGATTGLSPAALGEGGLTHRYSTSVPRKMASSTQVEVRIRRIRRPRWARCPQAWRAAG